MPAGRENGALSQFMRRNIKNFNSCELKFLIANQYQTMPSDNCFQKSRCVAAGFLL